jgi:signal transduction histidine kinase
MNKNGIGLGLVIADNLVSQFNGKIFFESEPGNGSTFQFTFKLQKEL